MHVYTLSAQMPASAGMTSHMEHFIELRRSLLCGDDKKSSNFDVYG